MKYIIAVSIMVLVAIVFVPQIAHAQLAQQSGPQKYLDLRAVVWNLFFRMTTAAFTVGAVVSGTMIWLVWRFRESHPKNKVPTKWEHMEDPTTGSYEEEEH